MKRLKIRNPMRPRGKGTVESCTLCVHRIDANRQPACVEACSDTGGGAMLFGDLNDPDSEISRRVSPHMHRSKSVRISVSTPVSATGTFKRQ